MPIQNSPVLKGSNEESVRVVVENSLTKELDDDLPRRFCNEAIKKMKQKVEFGVGVKSPQPDPVYKPDDILLIPPQLVNLVKMKAFMEKLRKAAEEDLHNPQRCFCCEGKKAEHARVDFIKRKTTQLQTPLLQAKLQSHYLNRNSICLIGEVLRDLPRPTDDPGLVWEALRTREEKLTQHISSS